MYAQERQEAIAGLIGQRGRVSVADLADSFKVTTETVRRDLDTLERGGLVRRVHGGAVPVSALGAHERSLTERSGARAPQKDRIAARAVELLPGDDATILVDGGTTTARLAARLPLDMQLTVVTNSVPAVTTLAGLANLRLEMLGGRVRPTTQACVGEAAVRELGDLRIDVVFLGANGLSVEGGATTPDSAEAAVKRAMVACGRKVVLLADSSKIGRDYLVRFARLDDLDVLVTDDEIDPDQLGAVTAAGVEVLIG
jgi:DeoR family fructose operon transcriptional repressor